MVEKTCVFAYTPIEYDGHYPPYFNLSIVDGAIVVTVRGPQQDEHPGSTSHMTLPRDEATELRSKLFDALLLTQPQR